MQQLQNIDPNKISIVNFSEIQGGRWDPAYIFSNRDKNVYRYASKHLGKLVSFSTGGTPSKEKPEYWNGNIYWVSAKDFKSFYIDSSEDTITELGLKNSSTKLIPENSLLIVARSGILLHTLPVAINKCQVTINQDIKALFVRDESLDVHYLGYFFDIFNKYVLSKIVKHSTTVQSVNSNELEKINIPIPPMNIQQRIVDVMDAAYSLKLQKEQQAEIVLNSIDDYLLGELGIVLPNKDAYYVDFCAEPQVEYGIHKKNELDENNKLVREGKMFLTSFKEISGKRLDPFYYQNKYKIIEDVIDNLSDKCRLGDVIVNLSNGIEVRDYVENGYRYLRVTDLGEHELSNASSKYININGIPNRVKLNTNCILVSRSGSLGLVNEVNADMLDYVLSSHIFKVELDTKRINPKYAVEILRNKICQNQIFRNNNGGIIPEIQQNALKSIKIPLPSLNKQQKIVEHISEIRAQAKQLQTEGVEILQKAKSEVEQMILGN